jgi:putative NADPH-quinone reductase
LHCTPGQASSAAHRIRKSAYGGVDIPEAAGAARPAECGSMSKRIAIIQGHPDGGVEHYGHALAQAYQESAQRAGHEVRTIPVASLEFPLIRSPLEFTRDPPPPAIREAQEIIRWAQHLVVVYPLWLGTLPALLKGFFEQTFRYGFALGAPKGGRFPQRLLKGRSARVIVTMGMPAATYRLLFRAHGVKSLDSGVLALSGFRPVRDTLIGSMESLTPKKRAGWLAEVRELGAMAK